MSSMIVMSRSTFNETFTKVEDLPVYSDKLTTTYNAFNLDNKEPQENDFCNDEDDYGNPPAIFSTRGTRHAKRPAPASDAKQLINHSYPGAEHTDTIKAIAFRFRKDFPLDCKAVHHQSWQRLSYYFDDLDIHHWGAEFLQRILICIFEYNSALRSEFLRFAVHLAATDPVRTKHMSYFGKANWHIEETAYYGLDFLQEMIVFLTHRSDVFKLLEPMAVRYREESRGDCIGCPMWYDETFQILTISRRNHDGAKARYAVKAIPPYAPSYRGNPTGDASGIVECNKSAFVALPSEPNKQSQAMNSEPDNVAIHPESAKAGVSKKFEDGEEDIGRGTTIHQVATYKAPIVPKLDVPKPKNKQPPSALVDASIIEHKMEVAADKSGSLATTSQNANKPAENATNQKSHNQKQQKKKPIEKESILKSKSAEHLPDKKQQAQTKSQPNNAFTTSRGKNKKGHRKNAVKSELRHVSSPALIVHSSNAPSTRPSSSTSILEEDESIISITRNGHKRFSPDRSSEHRMPSGEGTHMQRSVSNQQPWYESQRSRWNGSNHMHKARSQTQTSFENQLPKSWNQQYNLPAGEPWGLPMTTSYTAPLYSRSGNVMEHYPAYFHQYGNHYNNYQGNLAQSKLYQPVRSPHRPHKGGHRGQFQRRGYSGAPRHAARQTPREEYRFSNFHAYDPVQYFENDFHVAPAHHQVGDSGWAVQSETIQSQLLPTNSPVSVEIITEVQCPAEMDSLGEQAETSGNQDGASPYRYPQVYETQNPRIQNGHLEHVEVGDVLNQAAIAHTNAMTRSQVEEREFQLSEPADVVSKPSWADIEEQALRIAHNVGDIKMNLAFSPTLSSEAPKDHSQIPDLRSTDQRTALQLSNNTQDSIHDQDSAKRKDKTEDPSAIQHKRPTTWAEKANTVNPAPSSTFVEPKYVAPKKTTGTIANTKTTEKRGTHDDYVEERKLYVAGVGLTAEIAQDIFEEYRPTAITAPRVCKSTNPPGKAPVADGMMFCFVTFDSQRACDEVKYNLNRASRNGIFLKVNEAFDKEGIDRDGRANVPLRWQKIPASTKGSIGKAESGVKKPILDPAVFWRHANGSKAETTKKISGAKQPKDDSERTGEPKAASAASAQEQSPFCSQDQHAQDLKHTKALSNPPDTPATVQEAANHDDAATATATAKKSSSPVKTVARLVNQGFQAILGSKTFDAQEASDRPAKVSKASENPETVGIETGSGKNKRGWKSKSKSISQDREQQVTPASSTSASDNPAVRLEKQLPENVDNAKADRKSQKPIYSWPPAPIKAKRVIHKAWYNSKDGEYQGECREQIKSPKTIDTDQVRALQVEAFSRPNPLQTGLQDNTSAWKSFARDNMKSTPPPVANEWQQVQDIRSSNASDITLSNAPIQAKNDDKGWDKSVRIRGGFKKPQKHKHSGGGEGDQIRVATGGEVLEEANKTSSA